MRISHFAPPSQDVEHPNCPKCGTPMWLARIEPEKPHHDKRTYECPACDNVVSEIVKFS
jgi:hypothetical protein